MVIFYICIFVYSFICLLDYLLIYMKILGTGLNGLVGSRVVDLLRGKYEFQNLSRSTGVDITNKEQVESAISASDASIVLHLTAKTDVDGCEIDKSIDIKILGYEDIKKQEEEFSQAQTTWGINVIGTQNVIEACKKTGKKIIYISTDFVFDGDKGGYIEDDQPNPINWYGQTKYKGEEIIKNSALQYIILRIAYPYCKPHLFEPERWPQSRRPSPLLKGEGSIAKKKDFVQAIISRFQNNQPLKGITDHFFVPTFIDDIAKALDILISENAEGIYHVVGSQVLTPYEATIMIAQAFGFNISAIQKTTREEYFKDRALRPYNLSLKNDKIDKLGVKMRGFEEGLREIK